LKERIACQSRAGVEDEARDQPRQRRALHELADERAAHRVADQDQVTGSVSEGIARRGTEVAPLGQPHVVEAVGAGRGTEVVAVGDQQRRQPGAVEGGCYPQTHLGVVVDAVDDDRPGVRATGNPPGRERTQFAGDRDRGGRQPPGLGRVAGVDPGVEPNLHPRRQVAIDGTQASSDRVRVSRQHGAGNRVASLPVEPVDTRALGVVGSLEDDAPGGEILDGGIGGPAGVIGDENCRGEMPSGRCHRARDDKRYPGEQGPPPA
jgi:hypothetical protein